MSSWAGTGALDCEGPSKFWELNRRKCVNDQKCVRDNLSALKGTAEERSLAKRYTAELNTQEDTLAMLRRDLLDCNSNGRARRRT
jgi:hypothetical protein